MAQGLQCFDASGVLTLDITDRLTRVLGNFTTGTVNGSVSDSNLSSGNPWLVAREIASDTTYSGNHYMSAIAFTLSSSAISWVFSGSTTDRIGYNVTYGVY